MNRIDDDYEFATKNCKLLYKNLHKPCTETCMCWGWEFGRGWNSTVKELSTKLELLNVTFHKKYGISVVADQVKEKFGILHFYFHTEIDSPLIYRMWHIPFEKVFRWMKRNVDFKLKSVTDKDGYYSDEKEEIKDDELEERRKRCEHISNAKIEKIDGKWYEVTHLWHHPITHIEPTQHKFIYSVMNLMRVISYRTDFHKEPNAEQLVIQDAVDSIARKYVQEAEERCYNVCEDCGTQIGTEWSHRITTKGWISYICEKCDTKRQLHYAVMSLRQSIDSGKYEISYEDGKELAEIEKLLKSDDYHSKDEYAKKLETAGGIASRIEKKN